MLTVEYRVRNEATWVDWQIIALRQWVAFTSGKRACTDDLSFELIRIIALDISSMILIVICQLVVHEH